MDHSRLVQRGHHGRQANQQVEQHTGLERAARPRLLILSVVLFSSLAAVVVMLVLSEATVKSGYGDATATERAGAGSAPSQMQQQQQHIPSEGQAAVPKEELRQQHQQHPPPQQISVVQPQKPEVRRQKAIGLLRPLPPRRSPPSFKGAEPQWNEWRTPPPLPHWWVNATAADRRMVLRQLLGTGSSCAPVPAVVLNPGEYHDAFVAAPNHVYVMLRGLRDSPPAFAAVLLRVTIRATAHNSSKEVEDVPFVCDSTRNFKAVWCAVAVPKDMQAAAVLEMAFSFHTHYKAPPHVQRVCNPFAPENIARLPLPLRSRSPPPLLPIRPPLHLVYASSPLTRMRPFLRQFVAFHVLQGVEHFFLYEQDGGDGSREALRGYEEQGLVSWIPWDWRGGYTMLQTEQMNHAVKRLRGVAEWVLLTDLDEYVLPSPTFGSLANLLQQQVRDAVSRVCAVQMRSVFLAGGTMRIDETSQETGLVVDAYRGASLPVEDGYQKLVVRPSSVRKMNSIHLLSDDECFDDNRMLKVHPEKLVLFHYFNIKFGRAGGQPAVGVRNDMDRFIPELIAAMEAHGPTGETATLR